MKIHKRLRKSRDLENKEYVFKKLDELIKGNESHTPMNVLDLFHEIAKDNIQKNHVIFQDTLRILNIFLSEFCFGEKLIVKQLLEWMKEDIDFFIDKDILKMKNKSLDVIKYIESLKNGCKEIQDKKSGYLDYIT